MRQFLIQPKYKVLFDFFKKCNSFSLTFLTLDTPSISSRTHARAPFEMPFKIHSNAPEVAHFLLAAQVATLPGIQFPP
jgi:hypothetical protein